MLTPRYSERFIPALAGGVIGFALACTPPAAAQQANRPAADTEGGLEDIVVAAQPNRPAPVELLNGSQTTLSGIPTNGSATVAEPKAQINGLEGYIEGGFGSYGLKTIGGAVTIPLAKGKLELSVGGSEMRVGVR